jgi:hypothetical protein
VGCKREGAGGVCTLVMRFTGPAMRAVLAGAACAAGLVGATLGAPAVRAQTSQGTSPCDYVGQLPQCVAALGPLVDVTREWRDYQAATVQLVPISDYASDPEDGPPPLGVGTCGGETQHAAADGSTVPDGRVVAQPPAGIPAPPGTHGPYCLLSYFASDFTALCSGCHRVLVDFAGIPVGDTSSPGADGHWAARFSMSQLNVSAPFDGHSPNMKNLCSDKFFNPSAGSECQPYAQVDGYGLEFEGDATIYHHYPLEGRYYNGPAYLAGNGTKVAPYHWVDGAYFDVDPMGATGLTMWYGVGYRGRGDAAPDTDQSYGCLCEVPPIGHSAYSASYPLTDVSTPSGGGHHGGGGGRGAVAASSVAGADVTALPDTAAGSAGDDLPAMLAGGAGVALVVAARRRRRTRRATRVA